MLNKQPFETLRVTSNISVEFRANNSSQQKLEIQQLNKTSLVGMEYAAVIQVVTSACRQ